ncbi:MAG TPA: Flp family type IVb pilin [Gemmatimonadaceae bacterium]|jgi:pilus assembly protein Flp/PilA|nr:Flp family type IVb pilin [Gemmatimonadaceae bacterium]
MMSIARSVRRFVHDDEAATMPEYALMVALIAVVCIVAVGLIGTAAAAKFNIVQAAIAAAGG